MEIRRTKEEIRTGVVSSGLIDEVSNHQQAYENIINLDMDKFSTANGFLVYSFNWSFNAEESQK